MAEELTVLLPLVLKTYTGDKDETHNRYHGTGKAIFKSGNVYEGQFVDNYLQGKGTFLWHNQKLSYDGDFSKNKITGEGTYNWYVFCVNRGCSVPFLDCFCGLAMNVFVYL
jgi:hypothetical protein